MAYQADTRANDQLSDNSFRDFNFMYSNFNDVFEDINYDLTEADFRNAGLGDAPDRDALKAQVSQELRGLRGSAGEHDYDVGSARLAGLPGIALSIYGRRKAKRARLAFQAAVDKETEARYNQAVADYDKQQAEMGQKLIHDREQAAFGSRVQGAVDRVDPAMEGAARASERAQERMGLRAATPDLQREIDTTRAFDKVMAKASAANTTRAGLRDQSIRRAQIASGLGAAMQQQGASALEGAAGNAAARNQYNSQFTKGNPLISMLMGGVQGFMTGGPVGAAVGAGVGAVQGSGLRR